MHPRFSLRSLRPGKPLIAITGGRYQVVPYLLGDDDERPTVNHAELAAVAEYWVMMRNAAAAWRTA